MYFVVNNNKLYKFDKLKIVEYVKLKNMDFFTYVYIKKRYRRAIFHLTRSVDGIYFTPVNVSIQKFGYYLKETFVFSDYFDWICFPSS